jgi:hypothetical protein
MGEGLREVADVAARPRVELLGVQAEGTGGGKEPLAQPARPSQVADLRQRRHQPEGATHERAFGADQPVVDLVGVIAPQQAVDRQLVGDGMHGCHDPWVVRGKEPKQREEQQRGIECVGVTVLCEHTAIVDRLVADLRVDLVGGGTPLLGGVVVAPPPGSTATPSNSTSRVTDRVTCRIARSPTTS